jgi:hypothetical protein
MNYQREKHFWYLKIVDIIKFAVAVCAELVHKRWISQHHGITSVASGMGSIGIREE